MGMGKSSTSFKKGDKKIEGSGSKIGQKYSGVEIKRRILNCLGSMNLENDLQKLRATNLNKYWEVITKMLPNNIELTGGADDNRPLRLIIKGYSDRNNGHNTSNSSTS